MSFDNRDPSDGVGTRHDIDTGRKTMKHVFMTLGVLIVLGVFAAAGVMLWGFFNVAATETDSKALSWVFDRSTENSLSDPYS